MKSYDFEARAEYIIRGYVAANSEEEARKKIMAGDFDDLLDEDLQEPIYKVEITGCDDLD